MNDYDNKIKELEKEYQIKRKELMEIQKHIVETIDEFHEQSPDYVKIECPKCDGDGMIRNENKSLKRCDNCLNGRGYIYAKKYKKDDE